MTRALQSVTLFVCLLPACALSVMCSIICLSSYIAMEAYTGDMSKIITFDAAAFKAEFKRLRTKTSYQRAMYRADAKPRNRRVLNAKHFYDKKYLTWTVEDFRRSRKSTEDMAIAQGMGIDLFSVPVTTSARPQGKACLSCGHHKALNEFSPDKRLASGRHSYCKTCRADAAKVKYKRGAA